MDYRHKKYTHIKCHDDVTYATFHCEHCLRIHEELIKEIGQDMSEQAAAFTEQHKDCKKPGG